MTATADDHRYMAEALALAARGLNTAHPNPRVGCLIVADGVVVGRGWHERTGGPHAEAVALAEAGSRAAGATAYVSLEPCRHQGRTPPCTAALRAAGIRRVVYGAQDPDPRVAGGGAAELAAAGVEVLGGVMAAESRELNIGFVSRLERRRPWVRTKLAASLDGRTALAGGESRWISSEASRRDAHALRARSSAILTGAGTVLADDPLLTVRLAAAAVAAQPDRIVVDGSLRTPPAARMLREPGRTRIFALPGAGSRQAALQAAGGEVVVSPGAGDHVDLAWLLAELAGSGTNELLVEAGPGLNGALLDAGLVDEIVVYVAPVVLGSAGLGMFSSRPLERMSQRHEFELRDVRRLGPDARMTYRRRAG